uniref:Septin 8 n=1 Tax=Corvus moneduloides TaxID=1196302 RepID=A0A8U7NQ57_CORMO
MEAPRCRGTAALWNVLFFQHAERWRPSRDGEMGLCDPCRGCSWPFRSRTRARSCPVQCCTALTAPFSCQGHPCDVLAPRRQLTPGRGGGRPPGQPNRCSPVPLPSAAEGATLRAADGGTSAPAEGGLTPTPSRPAGARPAPPVPVPSVPPVLRAGGACGGRREFPGSGHIGSIQPHPPAAGSDSSAPAAGAAPVPVMAATDLERFSVNIIPIIAKADTISKSELHKFKIKIMSELVSNGVQIYQFPTDDEAVAEINSVMNAHLPFAVVGSTEEVKVGNKLVRARQYPWGVVQVENESHCDFVKLREMLIRVNMEDLREQTHTRHYELYRRCKLEEMGFKDTDPDSQPFSLQETYETKRKEFLGELQRKEEEMRQMFVNKVKETEAELKEKERELHEKFEHLKRIHQEERRKVEEKRRELEEEMNAFNRRKVAVETLQSQSLQATSQQPLKKDKDKKNRSIITGNQPGVCLSSSKVMITKANVEPLNCTSWWQAIQCCSCLVKSATWREGFL